LGSGLALQRRKNSYKDVAQIMSITGNLPGYQETCHPSTGSGHAANEVKQSRADQWKIASPQKDATPNDTDLVTARSASDSLS